MIDELYVIYRPIGCEDESSTDEEQGEKILCSFPADQSLDRQLLRVGMLEGLIDFTGKFSKESINSVVMEKKVWAFMQPVGEEGLWFIAGAPVDSAPNTNAKYRQQTIFQGHRPSGAGLVDGLNRLYEAFVMLRGGIIDIVNSGMDTIGKIAELRKKARKIGIRKRQEQLDYENILRDMETHEKEGDDGKQGSDNKERVGLKNNEGVSLDALHTKLTDSTEEIQSLELELNALVASPAFVLTPLRKNLRSLTQWFLQSRELHNCCGLLGIGGMHYYTVGHPAFQSLTLVRQAIEEITCGRSKGCLVLYDGQVVWSDLPDESTYTLYEFLRMQETERLRDIISEFEAQKRRQMIHAAQAKGSSSRRKLSISGRLSVDPMNNPPAPPTSSSSPIFEDFTGDELGPEEWLQCQMDCRGFITGDWGTVDLQDVRLGSPTKSEGSAEPTWPGSAHRSENGFTTTEKQQQPLCVEALAGLATNSHNVFFPPLYARATSDAQLPGTGATGAREDDAAGYLLSDLNLSDEYDELQRGVPTQLGRLLFYRQACFIMCVVMPELSGAADIDDETVENRDSRLASITSFDELLSKSERARHTSTSSLAGAGGDDDEEEEKQTFISPSSGRFSTEQDVIEMCGMLQRGLAEGVDQLLVSLGKKYKHLNVYGLQWQGVFKPTPTSSSPSGNTVTTRRTESINTNNEEAMNANNPLRASMDTAGASARRASIGDDGHTLSKNGTLKFDASLIVPIPSRPVVPSSGLPAGVSAYYFNSCNRAAKAPGLYDRQYDPQLYWPEPVVCLAHEGSPIRPLSSRNAMSEVLDDRYLSDLLSLYRHRFPMPASLTAATLPAVLVEAFNDLQQNLSSRRSRTDSVCTEACLRLGSVKGGGMWALGRRSGSRYLFLAIEGCASLQEMNNKVRRTTDGVFKRVVL